jgi:hypothetical protein
MSSLFGGVRAPSTLGSFLQSFTWGNVLQLEVEPGAAGRTGLPCPAAARQGRAGVHRYRLPAETRLGHKKQGAALATPRSRARACWCGGLKHTGRHHQPATERTGDRQRRHLTGAQAHDGSLNGVRAVARRRRRGSQGGHMVACQPDPRYVSLPGRSLPYGRPWRKRARVVLRGCLTADAPWISARSAAPCRDGCRDRPGRVAFAIPRPRPARQGAASPAPPRCSVGTGPRDGRWASGGPPFRPPKPHKFCNAGPARRGQPRC